MITRPESAAFPYLDGEKAGLTKREYFAAMALQGMLANSNLNWAIKDLAMDAVACADELIGKLNERSGVSD